MSLLKSILSLFTLIVAFFAEQRLRSARRAYWSAVRVLPALLLFAAISSHAQTGVWTWQGGSNLAYPAHVSGYPDARYSAAYWQDTNGNFWMFGSFSVNGLMNDLWEYNPTTQNWSLVAGSTTAWQPGVYGTQGSPSATNNPGSRYFAAYAIDANNNLWLYGGYGFDVNGDYGYLNDIWEFQQSSQQWIWWGGSQTAYPTAQYGAYGVASTTYQPNGENGSAMWIDANGNPWIYGGESIYGSVNDVWEFTPNTTTPGNSTWTLQYGYPGGPFNTAQVTSGSASAITPGGTYLGNSWVDASGNFWFYSGDNNYSGVTNTLWSYSTTTNEWTYENSSTATDGFGVYSSLGGYSSSNIPGARYGAASATGAGGKLLYFGGYGLNQSSYGYLNDLLVYNESDSEWAWLGGSATSDNLSGVYGTKGTPSLSNYPGGRYGSVLWVDQNDKSVYLFGGYGIDSTGIYGFLNDLWKFNPNGLAATPVITPNSQTFYVPVTVSISSTTPGAVIYYTTDGTTPITSSTTLTYSGPFTISATSTVTAIATASGYANSAPATATYTLGNYFWGTQSDTFTYGTSLGNVPGLLSATSKAGYNVAYSIHNVPVNSSTVLNAGQYQLDAIFTTTGGVYAGKISYKLTVVPAPLTVTPNPVTVTYGSAVPKYSYSITGYVNGDGSTAITGSPTVYSNASIHATSAGPVVYTSNVGNYTIYTTTGSLKAANYSFVFLTAPLTINQCTCSLTVTPYDANITLGSPIPTSFGYKVTGFVNFDDAANQLTGTAATWTNATSTSGHGYYTIFSGPGSLTQLYGNYAGINYNTATLTIH